MKEWVLTLFPDAYEAINEHGKSIEGRAPDPSKPEKDYGKLNPREDKIIFRAIDNDSNQPLGLVDMIFETTFLRHYQSNTAKDAVMNMLEFEGIEKLLPGFTDIEEGIQVYLGLPGYKERIAQHGIFAIGLGERIENGDYRINDNEKLENNERVGEERGNGNLLTGNKLYNTLEELMNLENGRRYKDGKKITKDRLDYREELKGLVEEGELPDDSEIWIAHCYQNCAPPYRLISELMAEESDGGDPAGEKRRQELINEHRKKKLRIKYGKREDLIDKPESFFNIWELLPASLNR
jgi:ASC-1-like (ASCH) protein